MRNDSVPLGMDLPVSYKSQFNCDSDRFFWLEVTGMQKAKVAFSQAEEKALSTNERLQATLSNGAPVESLSASVSTGLAGDLTFQDAPLLDSLFALDRERIPARVVHGKGAGAFGVFEVTSPEIAKYCKAKLFSEIGKKTPMAVRFSQPTGDPGSPDTVRDLRGFAMKFYTDEGNWDLVANNSPIFFIRDPILFPSWVHAFKRNPVTNLKDPNSFWDFLTLRPESMHQTLLLFSDRAITASYRHMNGYGSHTFKTVNDSGESYFVKWHVKSSLGCKGLSFEESVRLAGSDPDFYTRDLYEAIHQGDYPTWTMFIQVMTEDKAEEMPFNPFDLTKVWYHDDFPLIEVGKVTLNRNATNYFAEVEQMAFSPSFLVPGIQPSPDKMLQARLFSYPDTHHHRLGPNYMKIPVNCPMNAKVANYRRDGLMCVDSNGDGLPNYFPNSFCGPSPNPQVERVPTKISRWQTEVPPSRLDTGDDDNFSQPRLFFTKVLNEEKRCTLATNIVLHLKYAADFLQLRALRIFYEIDQHLGDLVKEQLENQLQTKMKVDLSMPSPHSVANTLSPPAPSAKKSSV